MDKKLFCNTVAQYKSKTVVGTDSVEWSGGAHCYLPSLKFYGGCSQSETPTPDSPVDIYCNSSTYISDSNGKYFYPPDLRGIGNYKDEWNYVTSKGLRYIHKVELDGNSEHGVISAVAFNGNAYYATYKLQHKLIKHGENVIISTHFKPTWSISHGNIYAPDINRLFLCHKSLSTIEEWNLWLAEQYSNGTPVTICYVVATPIPFEERHEWDVYEPISNESGNIFWGDGDITGVPVEITYITHS